MSDDAFFAEILWYRDFYDVPRLFCVQVLEGALLFDSAFDPVVDEYASTFEVHFFEHVTAAEARDPEQMIALARARASVGAVGVDPSSFDASRRALFHVPRKVGTYMFQPVAP